VAKYFFKESWFFDYEVKSKKLICIIHNNKVIFNEIYKKNKFIKINFGFELIYLCSIMKQRTFFSSLIWTGLSTDWKCYFFFLIMKLWMMTVKLFVEMYLHKFMFLFNKKTLLIVKRKKCVIASLLQIRNLLLTFYEARKSNSKWNFYRNLRCSALMGWIQKEINGENVIRIGKYTFSKFNLIWLILIILQLLFNLKQHINFYKKILSLLRASVVCTKAKCMDNY
jgi:hypothetical protein